MILCRIICIPLDHFALAHSRFRPTLVLPMSEAGFGQRIQQGGWVGRSRAISQRKASEQMMQLLALEESASGPTYYYRTQVPEDDND